MYEGKGKEIKPEKASLLEKLDISGRVVLKLADSLPLGSSIYADRYFVTMSYRYIKKQYVTIIFEKLLFTKGTDRKGREFCKIDFLSAIL